MGRLERRYADASITVADIQLSGLAGDVSEFRKRGSGRVGKWPAGRSARAQGHKAGTKRKPAVGGTAEQAMHLERRRKPMGCCPGKTRALNEFTKIGTVRVDGSQHGHGLVDNANAAYTEFHSSELYLIL